MTYLGVGVPTFIDGKQNPEYYRAYYAKNKEHILEKNRAFRQGKGKRYYQEYSKEYAKGLKNQVLSYYSNGELRCIKCGIADIDVLTLDHINGGGKTDRERVGSGTNFYYWLRKNDYPVGYQTLCFNCNMKKYIKERK